MFGGGDLTCLVLFTALLTDKGALLLLGQAFVHFIDVVPSLFMTSEVLTTKRAVKSNFHVDVFHVHLHLVLAGKVPGLVTDSIPLCWLFSIKEQRKNCAFCTHFI